MSHRAAAAAAAAHHRQHVEASLAQQVAQVGDGGVGGDVGGEATLALRLGQLEGAAQLVQRVPAHRGPDEHAIRFKDLLDLNSAAQRLMLPLTSSVWMKQKAAFQAHLSQRSGQVVDPVQTEEKPNLFIDTDKLQHPACIAHLKLLTTRSKVFSLNGKNSSSARTQRVGTSARLRRL